MLDVALVGTGGMTPLPDRWLASVLLRWSGRLILFDCGEGTQISLRQLGWGIKAIDPILISHLHGDHILGLAGLLLSQANAERREPVHIFGPPGLKRWVEAMRVHVPYLPFPLGIHELRDGDTYDLGDDLHLTAAEASHSVPCIAYRLETTRAPEFLPDQARALGIPVQHWSTLQRGQPVELNGRTIASVEVLGPPRSGLSVCLVGDTRPSRRLAELAHGVDLLITEGTFGADTDLDRAIERKHMTFREAATLARDARAKQLLLTHFSAAMANPAEYAPNATEVFPNTIVGRDHLTLSLDYPD